MMKFNFTNTAILVAIPSLLGSLVVPFLSSTDTAIAQVNTPATQITCQGTATVATKGTQRGIMIKWETNYFGKEYTPEQRCQIVSPKIQRAVNANGGALKGMKFQSGKLNDQVVICVLWGKQHSCDQDNMLFTLKPENSREAKKVIQTIVTFSQEGTGTINESSGEEIIFDLEKWENLAIPTDRNIPQPPVVIPQPPVEPSRPPVMPPNTVPSLPDNDRGF